jgi:hypothetical protein
MRDAQDEFVFAHGFPFWVGGELSFRKKHERWLGDSLMARLGDFGRVSRVSCGTRTTPWDGLRCVDLAPLVPFSRLREKRRRSPKGDEGWLRLERSAARPSSGASRHLLPQAGEGTRQARIQLVISRILLSEFKKLWYSRGSVFQTPILPMADPHRPRRTAHQREERRARIMAQVRAGFSYEAIARDESLSRERIRQIVSQSLNEEKRADRHDHNRLQIARLEPALRLAARGVEAGKLQAIGHLLKVLERMDKYGHSLPQLPIDHQSAHERLMRKLNCWNVKPASPEKVEDKVEAEPAKNLEETESDPEDL